MQSGEPVIFSASKTANHPEAIQHFMYLLGQTIPYHRPNDSRNMMFSLKDILFVPDEKGNPVPWTTDKRVVTQFVQVGQKLSLLTKNPYSKPDQPVYMRLSTVKPITHRERTHTDD